MFGAGISAKKRARLPQKSESFEFLSAFSFYGKKQNSPTSGFPEFCDFAAWIIERVPTQKGACPAISTPVAGGDQSLLSSSRTSSNWATMLTAISPGWLVPSGNPMGQWKVSWSVAMPASVSSLRRTAAFARLPITPT